MTLGIPRLRELLMTAAQSIKTPVMTLPLLPDRSRADAQALANRLRRLRLAEARALLCPPAAAAVWRCSARAALWLWCIRLPAQAGWLHAMCCA